MCPCVFLRSSDSDDTTKRKVNLVFEKIQTLKSRATGSAQGDNKVSRCCTAVIGLRTRQSYELLITGCPLTEAFTWPPVFTQAALRSWLMFKHVHAEWESSRVQLLWVATRCQNPNLCFLPRKMILLFFVNRIAKQQTNFFFFNLKLDKRACECIPVVQKSSSSSVINPYYSRSQICILVTSLFIT